MSESKPARRKLKTVGDLRAILANAIEDVISGDMDVHKATAIVKIASQINASLLAEVEVARFTLAQTNAIPGLGTLALDAPAREAPPTIEHEAQIKPELVKEVQAAHAPAPLTPSPAAVALANAATSMHAARTSRPSALAPRIIDHRPEGVVDLGNPPPGRSALDQRQAARA